MTTKSNHWGLLIGVVMLLCFSFSHALSDELSFTHDIPVVELTIDEAELWDSRYGLLAEGRSIDKSSLPYRNALYRQNGQIQRAGHMRLTSADGTVMVDQDVMLSLYGLLELDLPQKSFIIRAAQGCFNAELFDDSERTTFNSILLRNSGSDIVDTHIRECLISSLLGDYGAEFLYTHSRNAAFYINGQYWGLFQLEQSLDTSWAAYVLGVGPENAVLLDVQPVNAPILGTYADKLSYAEVIAHIKDYPPYASEENLQYLLEHVDIDAYINFMAMWIFLGNSDQSTLRIVRDADGRWQYVWPDSTWCLQNSAYNSIDSCMNPKGMGPSRVDNTIFLSLMDIPAYKDRFLSELGRIYQYFTSEKMMSIVDALSEEIRDEMMLHCVRWRYADLHLFDDRYIGLGAYESYQYWQSRIERLRNTCRRRPSFIWGQVQAKLALSDAEMQQYFGKAPVSWQQIINDI